MNNDDEKKNKINISLACIICVLLGYLIGAMINNRDCSGIGGFVYREIEWQEQTINVIKENCEFGMWVNDYSESDSMYLMCSGKRICKEDGYCKSEEWKSPIRTPKREK